MIKTARLIALTGAATTLLAALPASAQVNGIAVAETAVSVVKAKAFSAGYQQINTTYASAIQSTTAKRKEVNDLYAQLDKNGDKNVDQAEIDAATAAKSPVLTQIDQKQREIQQLQLPIVKAQIYVVEQIARKYGEAQQAVVTAKKISLILQPEALMWAPPAIDVTDAITTELDRLIPAASTAVPADYQPNQQVEGLYQQIQQIIANVAASQARAQAAQPAGAPAKSQAPSGR